MNFKFNNIQKFITLVTGLVTTITMSQPIQAQQIPGKYVCGTSGENPATIYKAPNGGELVFISWQSTYFEASGWGNQKRCEQVTDKLEQNRKANNLSYIVPGRFNGYPVVCASRIKTNKVTNCSDSSVLFTLKSLNDYNSAIEELLAINTGASQDPTVQSPVLETGEDYFIMDVSKMIIFLEKPNPPVIPAQPCTNTGRVGLCVD